MISHIFFDVDGVLTTNSNPSMILCQKLAEASGLDYLDLYDAWYPLSYDLMIGETSYDDVRDAFCAETWLQISLQELEKIHTLTPKNEEMLDLVRNLKKQWIACGIITDNTRDRIKVLDSTRGLSHIFSPIISSGDVWATTSSEVLFEEALSQADVLAQEALFIDNTSKNLLVPQQMWFATYHHDDYLNDIDALTIYLVWAWVIDEEEL